ncbi:MAG: peptidoglycan-binding protein [Lachnospiraceae bacterium]|nr:peptidoglycan-binding protein [Bacteroides fragilis]MCM1219014.1 peptidoglycan-binding protein [Lachnospiraceae bacterium]
MATQAQVKAFIEKIAPCAQKAYKELGKVLPSVAIGMACVESAYGTAGSCKHHSYLGHKVGTGKTAKNYWPGKFFTSKTKEEYTIGVHTTIMDAFRAYDSMEQCVFNFYELLNTSLYKGVQSGVDYKTQMEQIKKCKYMTSSTEVNSVISIVEKYNLMQYDTVVTDNIPQKSRLTVMVNARGSDVMYLQQRLSIKGYDTGKIDGIFGIKTLSAVKEFQKENGLAVDGIVGIKTWAKLV